NLFRGFILAGKGCDRALFAQQFEQHQQPQKVQLAGRQHAQHSHARRNARLDEPVSKFSNQLMRCIDDEPLVLVTNMAFRVLLTHQQQRRLNHLVKGPLQAILIAIADSNISRSGRIELKQQAVEVVVVVENTVRAEQNREKPQRRNKVARNLKTSRQRRRKQQPGYSPQPIPVHRGYQQRHRRDVNSVADDKWFGKLRRNLVEDHKGAKYLERFAPSGKQRKGDERRQQRRADRADIWNEPQQECDQTPQRGARQPQKPGYGSGGDAVREIDRGKKQQVAADGVTRGFYRLRCDRNSPACREPDKSIAQILSA